MVNRVFAKQGTKPRNQMIQRSNTENKKIRISKRNQKQSHKSKQIKSFQENSKQQHKRKRPKDAAITQETKITLKLR